MFSVHVLGRWIDYRTMEELQTKVRKLLNEAEAETSVAEDNWFHAKCRVNDVKRYLHDIGDVSFSQRGGRYGQAV
jgi:hypothetical protein